MKQQQFYAIKIGNRNTGAVAVTGAWTRYKWLGKIISRYYIGKYYSDWDFVIIEEGFVEGTGIKDNLEEWYKEISSSENKK